VSEYNCGILRRERLHITLDFTFHIRSERERERENECQFIFYRTITTIF